MELPLAARAVDLALTTIAPHRRPDLEARLRFARARLLDGRIRVLVVGEFKQGKSMLVNALVSGPVCPVFDDVATSVPTLVMHADEPTMTLVRRPGGPDAAAQRVLRTDIPLPEMAAAVARHVTEAHNPGNEQQLSHVEIGLPRHLLAAGLEILDTPGVGGLGSVHSAATMAALPTADAVLLVSDASQEYTAPELEFLRQAQRVCPNVACVLTKTDIYPEWRRIAQLDRAHLEAAGIDAELLTVSSSVRWQAVLDADEQLNAESGFAELETYLVQRVLGQADLLARRSTVHDITAVCEQILDTLRAEEAVLRDPDAVAEVVGELSRAQQRAVALKERSARWQLTLNDGLGDLGADIDHDLRDRMREITRVAEEEIDEGGDPLRTWDQLSPWIQQQVANASSANFLWATERARWLAGRVVDHFDEQREAVLPVLRTEASAAFEAVRDMKMPDAESWGIGQRALSGLRGGYIGVLMFGFMSTLVGLAMINPFSVGAGLLLGGKTVSDERRRVVVRRQAEAKAAVRRYVDDVAFQVGKDSRDMLRQVQRDLRDHFTGLAEQLGRSMQESLRLAEGAVRTTTTDRERRLGEIAIEIPGLVGLTERARTLVPEDGPERARTGAPMPTEAVGAGR